MFDGVRSVAQHNNVKLMTQILLAFPSSSQMACEAQDTICALKSSSSYIFFIITSQKPSQISFISFARTKPFPIANKAKIIVREKLRLSVRIATEQGLEQFALSITQHSVHIFYM